VALYAEASSTRIGFGSGDELVIMLVAHGAVGAVAGGFALWGRRARRAKGSA